VQAIFERAKDIRFALGLHSIYPYEEDSCICIAVSEREIKRNELLKILRSRLFSESGMKIPLALGYDIMGKMHIADLTWLVHLLVVGPSGTGKSIALCCIILSIITRCPVADVKLLLFDIGGNSLSLFSDIAHLYHPLVKDSEEALEVLESLVAEMNERTELGEEACKALPYIVLMIDEFDGTIAGIDDSAKSKRFVAALNSIIREGRKAKIILILASHDPALKNTKVNVSLIIPRIVFQCAKQHNSATAGVPGADKLPGGGALLFKSQEGIKFLQGSYVTTTEIERILSTAPEADGVKLMLREPETVFLSEAKDEVSNSAAAAKKANQELADITAWTLGKETISSRQIQERFHVGRPKADEILEKLSSMGIVTEKFANQPRTVIPQSVDEIPADTMDFLIQYGVSVFAMLEAIDGRC
jgi:S-DNA-T family DNA segregation ATPase FtsK/SpoIIIE